MLEHALAVLGSEAHPMKRNRQLPSDRARILVIAGRRAIRVVFVGPVAHEQALDIEALLLEQQSGYSRIHTAGKTDDHTPIYEHGAHSTRPWRLQADGSN